MLLLKEIIFYYSIRITFAFEFNPILSIFIDDGINICVSDEQLAKALFPISFTDLGIDIFVSDEQP